MPNRPNRPKPNLPDPDRRPSKKRRVKLPKTKTEPALIRGAVVAVLGLLASLGVGWAADVDKDTVALITGALLVLLPIVQAAWTRFAVTANAKVLARVSVTQGTVVAGEAAAYLTGRPLTPDPADGYYQVNVPVKPSVLPPHDDNAGEA